MTHCTSPLLQQLRRAALGHQGGGLSDGQLLRAFLHNHDECAFEALVRRHGPMVMGVCRRVLHHVQDAEDAFQAAFLVLVRRAPSLAGREIVGDWLHGVAVRTALKVRSIHARRRGKERHMAKPEAIAADFAPEPNALLDQELQGLPDKYRVPIILCELEGRTHQEAARQLGCPIGTLSGRLSRARTMLARRLTRRGLTLSAAGLGASLSREATAANVNPSLVGITVKAATQIAAGQAATGIVSSQVAALTEGVVKAMLMTKLKTLGAVVLVIAFLGVGAGALRPTATADENAPPPKTVPAVPKEPGPKQQERKFTIALVIAQVKEGTRKTIAEPKLTGMAGRPMSFFNGGEQAVKLGNRVQLFESGGGKVNATILANEQDRIDIDITVSADLVTELPGNRGVQVNSESVRVLREIDLDKPFTVDFQSKDKDAPLVQITATVSEVFGHSTLKAAERDYKVAEFYRTNGRRDSAVFVYELILRRYPDTLYAKQAREQIAALKQEKLAWPPEKKDSDQIGELVIMNDTKLKLEESVVLRKLGLEPRQPITLQRLIEAETRLLKSGLFENPPKIRLVLEGDHMKKLIVTIEE